MGPHTRKVLNRKDQCCKRLQARPSVPSSQEGCLLYHLRHQFFMFSCEGGKSGEGWSQRMRVLSLLEGELEPRTPHMGLKLVHTTEPLSLALKS